MEKKITGSQAAKILAAETGRPVSVCEVFLKSLFANVAAGLKSDGIVKSRDFGTFRLTEIAARKSVDVNTGESNEIPPHIRVTFVPSKELAAAVNAPFEMFQTVELTEDVLDEELMQAEAAESPLDMMTDFAAEEIREREVETVREAAEQKKGVEEHAAEVVAEALGSVSEPSVAEADADDFENSVAGSESDSGRVPDGKAFSVSDKEVASADENENSSVSDNPVPVEASVDSHVRKRGFGSGFIWGIVAGLVAVVIIGTLIWGIVTDWSFGIMNADTKVYVAATTDVNADNSLSADNDETGINNVDAVSQEDVVAVEENSVEPVTVAPTQPSDRGPVYDTISHTRFLTTMAKDHYGNYHLWPYIYEENKSRLGHPDRIRPGTRVVIPDLGKYGVNPEDPNDIAAAKRKGAAIYARYK